MLSELSVTRHNLIRRFITSSRYQWNQFRAGKAERTHLRVPKSPEGGRPCRPSRSPVPVYKRFYCFRSNRTLLNFSNFDLSRSCRNLIPPYLRRRRSPAAWLQYTSLIIRTECGAMRCGNLRDQDYDVVSHHTVCRRDIHSIGSDEKTERNGDNPSVLYSLWQEKNAVLVVEAIFGKA